MKNIINRILALFCGLILIGCNSGGSSGSGTPANLAFTISLSSGSTANVPTTVSLILTFNQAVTNVNPTTVRVESPNSPTTNIITDLPEQNGNIYTFNLSGLTLATTYTVTLTNGITSVATGLPIVPNPFSFTTTLFPIPTVVMTQPINGSSGVALNTPVILQFSESVEGVSTSTLSWTSSIVNAVQFTIESGANNTYTLSLVSGTFLNLNSQYTVQVNSGISSVASRTLVLPTTFNFTTTVTGPTVRLTSPNPTANVRVTTPITLTFSESVTNVNTNTIQFESKGFQPESITIIESGNSYTVIPSRSLLPAMQYVVIVNSGISSVATGALVAPIQFNFTTSNSPIVSLTSPNPTTNTSITPTIIIRFSEPVSGVNTNSIQFQSQVGLFQPITIMPYSNNDYILILNGALLYAMQYVVLVNSGITSVDTGSLVEPTQFNFTTESLPSVRLTSPNPATNVNVTTPITLTFSEAVSGVDTTTIQLLGPGSQPQTINITQSGNSYTLTTSEALLYATPYVVVVNSGIRSSATGALVVPINFNFTTAVQPTVSLTSPNTTTNVILTPNIILTFSEAVTGVNTNTIQLQSQGVLPLPITITPSGNSYTLNLSQALLGTTQYLVLVNSGISSVATGAEVAPIQFSFTTRIAGGPLTALSTPVATYNRPYGLSISPDGKNVYVNNINSNTISQYRRNSDGTLTALSPATVAAANQPVGIIVSPDGLNVYATGQLGTYKTVSQYSRNSDGTLTALSPATVQAGFTPQAIGISPDGKNVYVANNSDNTLSQYSRNSGTGQLTLIGTIGTGRQPFGIIVSPDSNFVYVTNPNDGTVSQYRRNSDGTLTALSPATVVSGNTPNQISISPFGGNNVYVTNQNGNNLSQFSRNTSTGILTALSPATVGTQASPQAISISPDGLSAYVANYSSDSVSQYSRNSDGTLTALSTSTVTTGFGPFGIIVSPDGLNAYVTNEDSNIISQYSR